MAKSSRYFTPPLRTIERTKILDLLGLSTENFDFIEVHGAQVLLSQEWRQGSLQTTALFTNGSQKDAQNDRSKVIVDVEKMATEWVRDAKTPFEEILLYPFNLILCSRSSNGASVSVGPTEFNHVTESLRIAIQDLEQAMAESELSCLWIRNGNERMPLLFHFVRRRLIRVGTLQSLFEIGYQFDEGALTPALLRQFFGTSVAFFVLNIEPFNTAGASERYRGFQRLYQSARNCLSQSAHIIRAASPIPSALTDGDLGLV